MRRVRNWMLAVAVVATMLSVGVTKASAQYGYQGAPSNYVPPPPGPGYSWVNGYMDDGYWVPGRWVYVGGEDQQEGENYGGAYAGPYAPGPYAPAPYAAPYAAPYGGYQGDDDDQGGDGGWQNRGGWLGNVIGGVIGGWGGGWGGDDQRWGGGDDGGDDD